MPHAVGNGAIFGIVSKDGVAEPGFPVKLYDRTTGNLVGKTICDSNGGFAFTALNSNTNDYQVVATDESAPPYKNALIMDRIQPIPAYAGSNYDGNYRFLAFQKGAKALFDGLYVSNGSQSNLVSPYPTLDYPRVENPNDGSESAQVPTSVQTIAPGMPNSASVKLVNQRMFIPMCDDPMGNGDGHDGTHSNPATSSIELLVDVSSLAVNSQTTGAGTGNVQFYAGFYNGDHPFFQEYSSNYTTHTVLEFNLAAKTITLYQNNGGGPGNLFGSLTTIGTWSYAALSGVHHFLFSITYGATATLFVDGAQVTSFSLAGKNTTIGSYNGGNGWDVHLSVGSTTNAASPGQYSGMNGVQAIIGAFAFYPYALTAQDASDLYSALMGTDNPLVTGYAKEVWRDRPSIYARLNEATTTYGFVNMTRAKQVNNGGAAGTITLNQPSPVLGGSLASFNGSAGIRFNAAIQVGCNPYGYTFSTFYKPNIATPAAAETLFEITNSSAAFWGMSLVRTTTGILQLSHSTSAATETVNFRTVISDVTKAHLYHVVADKVAGLASLYIDGAFAESVALNSVLLSYAQQYPSATSQVQIGGIVSSTNTVSSGANGQLGEVAFFPVPLTAARIAAHYAAISTP